MPHMPWDLRTCRDGRKVPGGIRPGPGRVHDDTHRGNIKAMKAPVFSATLLLRGVGPMWGQT